MDGDTTCRGRLDFEEKRKLIKLSIVVPVRDAELYISDALASLVRNAHRDFEFIVVDDGSVDATGQIIEDFRSELPGLVVLRNETPVGLADARNLGLSRPRGRYRDLPRRRRLAGARLPRRPARRHRGPGLRLRPHRPRPVHGGPQRSSTASRTAAAASVLRPARRDPARRPHHHASTTPTPGPAIYHRGSRRGLLHFTDGLRTAEDRPWIWRLHREASSFAVVGLRGRLLPARCRLLAHPDRRRAAARLHPRLRPGPRGNGRTGVRTAAAQGRAHLLRDSFPTIWISGEVRAAGGPRSCVAMSAAALKAGCRSDVLEDALDSMDTERASRLRRLRRAPRPEHPAEADGAPDDATTQIFFASTLYGAATLAAAIDAGRFGPHAAAGCCWSPTTRPSRRPPRRWTRCPASSGCAPRFDGVLSWNDIVAPFHPGGWSARARRRARCWERLLRLAAGTSATTRSSWSWSPSRSTRPGRVAAAVPGRARSPSTPTA